MLNGEKVKSLIGIHQQCKVLIVSPHDKYKGLKGFSKFGSGTRPSHAIEIVKPKPATWIKTATCSWFNQNETVDMPDQQPQLTLS